MAELSVLMRLEARVPTCSSPVITLSRQVKGYDLYCPTVCSFSNNYNLCILQAVQFKPSELSAVDEGLGSH